MIRSRNKQETSLNKQTDLIKGFLYALFFSLQLLPVLSKAALQAKTFLAASQAEVAASNGSSEPSTYSASFTEPSKKKNKPRKTWYLLRV